MWSSSFPEIEVRWGIHPSSKLRSAKSSSIPEIEVRWGQHPILKNVGQTFSFLRSAETVSRFAWRKHFITKQTNLQLIPFIFVLLNYPNPFLLSALNFFSIRIFYLFLFCFWFPSFFFYVFLFSYCSFPSFLLIHIHPHFLTLPYLSFIIS